MSCSTFLTSGNKGGVGISFSLGTVSLCFVNCHLAARSTAARVLRSDLFSFTFLHVYTISIGNHTVKSSI